METRIIDDFDSPEYLTTEEVAKLYPFYSANTLRVLRYRGKSPLPYIKITRKVLYDRSEVERILGKSTVDEYID
tara:strand:- start:23 stop:244 length:222 start_codon:yes stop_codon:yes gene_type:complete